MNIDNDSTERPDPPSAESESAAPPGPMAESGPESGPGPGQTGRRRDGLPEGAGAKTAYTSEEVGNDLHRLDFGVHKSLRYHATRRRFLENLHRAAMTSAVVSATTAYAAVAGAWSQVSATVSVIAATMTILDVVVGFNQRAQTYESLYRRFSELAARIARVADPTEDQVREWRAERLMVEADEPPPIETLNVICHNLEAEARELGLEEQYEITRWNRTFAQFFTVTNDFPRRGSAT